MNLLFHTIKFAKQYKKYKVKQLQVLINKKHGEYMKKKMKVQLCLPIKLIKITIENLLHFLEYFNNKIDSMKNFPLGFEEVQSIQKFYLLIF